MGKRSLLRMAGAGFNMDFDTCFNELSPLEQVIHNFAEAFV